MIGAANLVPGPSSTEVAIHIGHRRAGVLGMLTAGVCFIVPAALLVTAIAWAYVRYHDLAGFQSALYGIKPVVVAIVAQAIMLLTAKVVKTSAQRAVLGATLALSLAGLNQLLLLLGCGVVMGGSVLRRERSWKAIWPVLALLASVACVAGIPLGWEALRATAPAVSPLAVFLYFGKLGSVLYGGGYVMLAFLEADLVVHWKWLSKTQLLDAIAVGQFTPGPVFTTATYIGYILAGPLGALAGTVGIFLPAFIFVAVSAKLLSALRASPVSGGFLDGVNAAAIGLMGAVLVRISREAVVDWTTVSIAVVAFAGLWRWKLNTALLIGSGALAGVAASLLR